MYGNREVMDVVDGWLLKELLVWWKRRVGYS